MDKVTANSSFGQWVAPLEHVGMSQIVGEFQGNKYVKKLRVESFVRLFVYAQLYQRKALRDIESAVRNNRSLQCSIGLESISISQLSRTCERLDP